jgi:hypothetical protein
MCVIAMVKTSSFKLSILALSFVALCCFLHSKESMNDKAKRISFPGVTHVNFNRSMKDLTLEKVDLQASPDLLQNLHERQIKMTSPLFKDKENNLTVMIGETLTDNQMVFALIKNNQVTQIQKINEITNENIVLQYGKVTLNAQVATAATNQATDPL